MAVQNPNQRDRFSGSDYTPSYTGPSTQYGAPPSYAPMSNSFQTGSNMPGAPSVNPYLAAMSGGLGFVSDILNRRSANKNAALDRDAARRQFLAGLMGQEVNLAGDHLAEGLDRDRSYMDSFNMNPVQQQQDIFRAAALRNIAAQGAPRVSTAGVSNVGDYSGIASQFLNDGALGGAAARFFGAQGSLSDTAPAANLGSMGFGGADALQSGLNDQVSEARAIREALRQKQRDALFGAQNIAMQDGSNPLSTNAQMMYRQQQMQAQRPQSGAGGAAGGGIDYFNRQTLG